MDKQSLIYNNVVYLAIPKRLYDNDICTRAIKYIKTLRPLATIDPREVFESNEQWLRIYKRYLKPCDSVVVITDNGIVGKGVHTELQYFNERKLSCYAYHERGEFCALLTITGLHVIDWNNWIDYARIEYE